MVDVDVHVSSHLKDKLVSRHPTLKNRVGRRKTKATDKRLWVIITIMLFVKPKELKGTKELSRFKFKTILFALLCGP